MLFELPIVFHSQGVPLVGRIFRNTASLQERQPAVITMGSWLTVKEQMATIYARRLAESGYTTFVFDFSGFGESRGDPRQAEIPSRKIRDIEAAVALLQTLAFVDPTRIGCLAICASAQYALRALADGAPIRSFVSVAGWYHDPASVAPFYGGDRVSNCVSLAPARPLTATHATEQSSSCQLTRTATIALACTFRSITTVDPIAAPSRHGRTRWPR